MKNIRFINSKITLLLGLIFITVASCERPISDEVEFATYPATPEIFIDGFMGGLDYFPFGDSFAEAFSVDTETTYLGSASMRFDIPVFGVGYGGATFPSTGPRNLTGYDALTFWVKSTRGADINEIGYGINGDTNNKFQVTLQNVPISTVWTKVIIPIPDPSKLTMEKGMFWYAEGAENATDEGGYTFWIDELKFEKLGTIAQPQPKIFGGVDVAQSSFTGSSISLTGLSQTFNLATSGNKTVNIAPSYFMFNSSDTSVATVSELGVVNIIGSGTSTITGIIAGVKAKGSLIVSSSGGIPSSPTPTQAQVNVKSIFSDNYTLATPSNFDPKFGGSTTEYTLTASNGNAFASYTNNNYTGIQFENTVDASTLTHFHVDVYTQGSSTSIGFQIRDFGANGVVDTDNNTGLPIGDDKDFRFTATGLTVGGWTSFDIALEGDLATQKNKLGSIVITDGPNFLLDNIYFYKQ